MSDDPITRLNAALEGRYRIESELGEGGMGDCPSSGQGAAELVKLAEELER